MYIYPQELFFTTINSNEFAVYETKNKKIVLDSYEIQFK